MRPALLAALRVHAWFGWRQRNTAPTGMEILGDLLGWSALFEVSGPRILRAPGDVWDVVAAGNTFSKGHFLPMSFDLLAPHYRWLERVLAGNKLHRCRTAFLTDVPAPRVVLLLGEGNGRGLEVLLRIWPTAQFTCVDASARMLECARARLTAQGLDFATVHFIHADVLEWTPPTGHFDLIVTNFFLDCFRPDQLAALVPRLAQAAKPGARWLLADFCEPPAGLAKWRARLILRSMYIFFRVATRLPAARLTPPDSFLRQSGFALRQRRTFEWGLLHSDLWERLEVE